MVYKLCALKHLTRSDPCLFLLVFEVYRGIANKDITDSIKSEMSGDLEDALLAVGECPALHFVYRGVKSLAMPYLALAGWSHSFGGQRLQATEFYSLQIQLGSQLHAL